jgi:hypothetical protein
MLERCKNVLKTKHWRLIESGQLEFVHSSITDFDRGDPDLTFVIMFELLDNLPHDRVYLGGGGEVLQTMVDENFETGVIREVRVPMVDQDVRDVWEMHLRLEGSKGSIDQRSFDRSLVRNIFFGLKEFCSWSLSINGGKAGRRRIMCSCRRSVIGC